ncbi:MAG: hypothetical protein FD133_120 [Erysipelotrichaceae bacterium]|nr:MAG: hypothetical protein FD179_1400 [Erysipelotrichaceae bacterium]TXT20001.1 MAG: hypothetical protein FD133_120 [Erysipelotrichaceae bacterium]
MLETVLSLAVFALSLWALDALNFNKLLKSNRVMQAQVLYLFMAMALTALVVQFLLGLRITN